MRSILGCLKKYLIRMKKAVYKALVRIEQSRLAKAIPDKLYVSIEYFFRTHRLMKWKKPKTYNEKLNWLKIYNRNPDYCRLVDKQEMKGYVDTLLGPGHTIPTIGIYNKFDDIDFDKLPEQFVLKCTHDSGGIKICRNRINVDLAEYRAFFDERLARNYYYHGRQWYYKGVKPRIIAEPLLVDESQTELKDYKVFCFDGIPKFIEVDFDRQTQHHRNLYTTKWEYIDAEIRYPSERERKIEKPMALDKMLDISQRLSAGIKHVRVDMYVVNEEVLVGELTFFHENGYGQFRPYEFGITVGKYIVI